MGERLKEFTGFLFSLSLDSLHLHFYSFSECLVDASFICFLSFAEGRSHLVIVFKHLHYRGFNHPLDMLSGCCESSMKPAHRDSKGTFH